MRIRLLAEDEGGSIVAHILGSPTRVDPSPVSLPAWWGAALLAVLVRYAPEFDAL